MDLFLFYVFGAIAIGTSMLVIGQRNPMYSVLLLIGAFGALAGLYVLLDAPFVAVIQIIIYAGAIMVVFLFVVMLLNAPREEVSGEQATVPASVWRYGVILTGALAVELVWALSAARGDRAAAAPFEPGGSVRDIGRLLFTEYGFAVQATAVLTLVAMIGAIVLAGRRR